MSRFNTGNPIGSADPRDRDDNSKNLDEAMNKAGSNWTDRLGRTRKTFQAAENAADLAEQAASQAITDINQQVAGFEDEVQAQINDLLVAGGQVFPDEATGRAAVQDGQYFYAESDDPNVSKTLWQRVSSSESRFVADDPSAEFIENELGRVVRTFFAPFTSFYQRDCELLVDRVGRRLKHRSQDGARYFIAPFTSFEQQDYEIQVDNEGWRLRLRMQDSARYFVGPFTSFGDRQGDVIVDVFGYELPRDEPEPEPGPEENPVEQLLDGKIYVTASPSSRTMYISWALDGETMIRLLWRPNGVNEIFNYRQTSSAPLGDPATAPWSNVQGGGTDWLPPMTFSVVNNGSTPRAAATGGAHAARHDDSPTGETVEFEVWLDDEIVTEPKSGFFRSAKTRHSNLVMAYNSIDDKRYAMRQDFGLIFTQRSVEVLCDMTALEDVRLKGINGAAAAMASYQDSVHYYGNSEQGRMAYGENYPLNSGPWNEFPEAWAAAYYSSENGYLFHWTNRKFGIGVPDPSRIDEGLPLQFMTTAESANKGYQRLIRREAQEDQPVLVEGETVSWHGGYAWASPATFSGEVDSVFKHTAFNKPRYSYAQLSPGAFKIKTERDQLIGTRAGVGLQGPNGFMFYSGEDYTSESVEIEK